MMGVKEMPSAPDGRPGGATAAYASPRRLFLVCEAAVF